MTGKRNQEHKPTLSYTLLRRICLTWPASTVALIVTFTLMVSSARAAEPWVAAFAKESSFAIMRHAIAPGTGDPSNFSVDDCTTQRNLSDEGREQAQNIGNYIRANGFENLAVYSSQWCRCLETAELLNFGDVQPLPFLNSFFNARENEPMQMQQLKAWLTDNIGDTPMILVTHQVNITALTGVYPASGEVLIVKRNAQGDFEVVDTFLE